MVVKRFWRCGGRIGGDAATRAEDRFGGARVLRGRRDRVNCVAWGVELVRGYLAVGATASEMAEWAYVRDENGQQGRLSVGVIRRFGREEWTSDRAVLLVPEGGVAVMEPLVDAPSWFVPPRPGRGNGASVRAYGWPLRCMSARMERWLDEGTPNNFTMKLAWHGAWRVEAGTFLAVLPLRPVWGGLLVDSRCSRRPSGHRGGCAN
jgi:hypothetical protein